MLTGSTYGEGEVVLSGNFETTFLSLLDRSSSAAFHQADRSNAVSAVEVALATIRDDAVVASPQSPAVLAAGIGVQIENHLWFSSRRRERITRL